MIKDIKMNLADRFGNEVIIYGGLPMRRTTAYRFIGDTAFAPYHDIVTFAPLNYEAALKFFEAQERNT